LCTRQFLSWSKFPSNPFKRKVQKLLVLFVSSTLFGGDLGLIQCAGKNNLRVGGL
jgi:hypothetical protein